MQIFQGEKTKLQRERERETLLIVVTMFCLQRPRAVHAHCWDKFSIATKLCRDHEQWLMSTTRKEEYYLFAKYKELGTRVYSTDILLFFLLLFRLFANISLVVFLKLFIYVQSVQFCVYLRELNKEKV